MRKVSVTVTTIADGSATVYTDPVSGFLHAVRVQHGNLDHGGDYTITDAGTGLALLTLTNVAADATYYPRVLLDDLTGADLAGVYDRVPVDGAIKIVAAQAGNGASGVFTFYVAEE